MDADLARIAIELKGIGKELYHIAEKMEPKEINLDELSKKVAEKIANSMEKLTLPEIY